MDLRASLHPVDYVDPAVFAAELRHVLRASWLPIGRIDQVPQPGDHLAATVGDEPMLLVRGADGDVRVFANVCPHRGSRVVEDGPGHADVLICPYHRCAFRTDGSLVGAPFADEADLDGACLVALRHVEWKGFVLVNPSGDAPEPFDDLAGLDDHLAPWRWDELVTIATKTFESEWNWKVMVENWIECYHHLGAHRETVEPFWAASAVHLLAPGARPWAAMTVEGIEGTGGPAETWIPGMDATKARDLSVWSAFPLLLGGGTSGHAFWLQIEPLDVTHHRVTWHLLAHPDRMLDAAATDALMEEITMVHVEDMRSCRDVQAGLESGRIPAFRLTRLEAPVADFQRWVAGRLAATV